MAKKVKMPGRIESSSLDGIVTGAAEIFDDGKEKMQNVINTEVSAELLRLENEKQNNLTIDNTPTEGSRNPVTSGGVFTAEKALSDAIEAILILIPSAATALNQLADKSFVESSLSTATATFRGTYNVVSDLGLAYNATHEQIAAKLGQVISTADNNDYCFVQVPESATSTDIKHTERYKFNGSVWAYEYDLNNSGFTADQWAAINSNITAVLVAKLTQLPTAEVLATLLAGKQDNLTFDDRPTAGSDNPVKSGGVKASENEIIALINALELEKQDKLTFDSTPTNGSSNPVTSGGVYEAINLVQVALASLDNRVISAEHSISVLTENVGILRSLYQALTSGDIIVGSLPTTGVANTVYRVPGDSTYADWMYYNGAWVKLAEYTTLDGYLYKGIAIPSGSPAASAVKMFYFALTAGIYTNFGGLVCTEGINILKYDGANWTKEQITYTDGGVFDISAYHATGGTLATYANLSAALDSNNGGGVPQSLQKGGMSVKYVRTYDNKYVQYRLTADSFTIDTTQWAICGDSIYVENPEYLFAIIDKDKKVLCGIRQDYGVDWMNGVPKPIKQEINNLIISLQEVATRATVTENTKVDKETGKSLIIKDFADRVGYVENPEYSYAMLLSGSVVFGITIGGEPYFGVIPKQITKYVEDFINASFNNAVVRNKDKESAVYAACRYRQIRAATEPIQKDFQISIITDTHSDNTCIKNAIDVTESFKSIDAIIHCGDLEVFAPRESTYNLSKTIEMFNDRMKTKPWLMVCGNHDVGVSHYIYFTRTHEEVYNDFVKPLIDNGTLKSGEYQTTGNYEDRCYYFHDFADRKVRLIVLYEYAWPLVLEDSNPYWEPVTYDASYPMMQNNTTYTYDENNPIILNCGGWKENSFRLKQTVTTIKDPTLDRTGKTIPGIKSRSCRFFNINQINWLANVLNSTPNDYGVVIATHIPACVGHGTLMEDSNFCIKSFDFNAAHDIVSNVPVLIELVNAWVNKSTLVERVKYTNNVYSTNNGYDVEYVNVLGSGDDTYAYEINLDFSERTNNGCYFGGFLGGHLHVDLAVKSTDYPYQITIAPCCGNPRYRSGNDTANVEDINSVAYDNITVFSCNNNRIGLARIGNIKTTDGRTRDFEVININS